MYDSTKIKQQDTPITLDYILSKVTEYDIYARYIGQFKIGFIYNSPFREDKNPSFGIFRSRKSGKLLFKDHGNGECGNVIKFVELYTGLTNYNDILNRIVTDMSITNNTKLKSTKQYESKDTVIGVVRQDWTDVDHFKIYRPLADKYTKWRNNLASYDIQGYEQLPKKGDLLIITKSLKDVMCLYEMGYTAISPSSESTFISDKALNQLKRRFKRILICFDRDVSGIKNMRKISLKTGLNGFLVHKKWKAKDISDAVKLNGFEIIKNWLKETL